MNISTLQSLIDRTSNQIAECEACVQWEKQFQTAPHVEAWEKEQSNWTITFFKRKLPKLREVQKELKREIAKEIKKAAQQRFYDSM